MIWRVFKNLLGLLLVLTCLAILFTPGRGKLFIFIGLTLLDFPGKQKLIRRMLGRRGVLRVINKIRKKAERRPLQVPVQ